MSSKTQLLHELDKLDFRKMWAIPDAENDRKFTLFIRSTSSEVGSPFGMVLIMDYSDNNGFEVFTTLTHTNNITDDINILNEKYTGNKLKIFSVTIGDNRSELFTMNDFKDYNLKPGQVSQIAKLKAGQGLAIFDFNEEWEIKRIS